MKKAFALILILAMAFSMFSGCMSPRSGSSNVSKATDEPGEVKVTEAPTDEPIEAPTEAPTEEPAPEPVKIEARPESLVTHSALGTVYISNDGGMYAVEGDNVDSLFGGAECVEYTDDDGCVFRCIKRGSTPFLLDTGVKKARFLYYSDQEQKIAGQYCGSLIYLKDDGTVWLRGSNPLKLFGDFEKAEEPVKLFDNAANIGADAYSVTVGLEDGRIFCWDLAIQKDSGKPMLMAENADVSILTGDRMYMTRDGELFVDDTLLNPEERMKYVSYGKDFVSFGGGPICFWTLSSSGELDFYHVTDAMKHEKTVLGEDIVFAASPVSGARSGVWCIDSVGIYRAYEESAELMGSIGSAVYGGMDNAYMWAINEKGQLFVNNKRTADNALYAVAGSVPDSCIYLDSNGQLYSISMCTPEDMPQNEPFAIPMP